MSTKKTTQTKSRRRGTIEFRNGSYSFRFSYYDALGKRRSERSSGFQTKKEAEDALAERIRLFDQGFVKDSKTRLDAYLRQWMTNKVDLGVWRETTQETTRIHVEKYIIPNIGSKTLGSLRGDNLETFYATLLREGRTGRVPRKDKTKPAQGLSPKTVRNIAGTLHKALEDAVKAKIIVTNPSSDAELPKWKKPDLDVWDERQVATFLEYCLDTNDDHFVYWRLLFATGLRRGEIMGLRWIDVDFAASTIRVEQTRVVANGKVVISDPKTDAGRRAISIDTETLVELARLKNQQEEWFGAPGSFGTMYVATRRTGLPIHPLAFYRRFKVTAKKAGLPVIRLHDGRHTSANLFLQEPGTALPVVSGRFGHSKVSTTLDIYGHFIPAEDQIVADKVGSRLVSRDRRPAELDSWQSSEAMSGRENGREHLKMGAKPTEID